MTSSKHGKRISKPKQQGPDAIQVHHHGLWLLIGNEEFLLDYENFPWFENATVKQIFHCELRHGIHLRWPDLDVDLHIESLRAKEHYPLFAQPKQ
jgi:hypothetical protein